MCCDFISFLIFPVIIGKKKKKKKRRRRRIRRRRYGIEIDPSETVSFLISQNK